jgi:hypothetical protein
MHTYKNSIIALMYIISTIKNLFTYGLYHIPEMSYILFSMFMLVFCIDIKKIFKQHKVRDVTKFFAHMTYLSILFSFTTDFIEIVCYSLSYFHMKNIVILIIFLFMIYASSFYSSIYMELCNKNKSMCMISKRIHLRIEKISIIVQSAIMIIVEFIMQLHGIHLRLSNNKFSIEIYNYCMMKSTYLKERLNDFLLTRFIQQYKKETSINYNSKMLDMEELDNFDDEENVDEEIHQPCCGDNIPEPKISNKEKKRLLREKIKEKKKLRTGTSLPSAMLNNDLFDQMTNNPDLAKYMNLLSSLQNGQINQKELANLCEKFMKTQTK